VTFKLTHYLIAGIIALAALKPTLPPRMTGDLNIAVAEFGAKAASDPAIESLDGRDLAQSIFASLSNDFNAFNSADGGTRFDIQVWPPAETGRVEGSTETERAQEATNLAQRINADVIIYANLQTVAGMTSLVPEFYLSGRKLRDAEELLGHHKLASPVEGRGDITENPAARRELRERLRVSTRALAQFIIGLGYYAMDDLDAAATHFEAAESTKGWDACRPCSALLYLFLGNSALKRWDLASADGYYARALQLSPEYARARLGAAEVLFQKSRGDCETGHVDANGVQAAVDGYWSVL
jgi:tetratricopeptide (TPR) repeat protein